MLRIVASDDDIIHIEKEIYDGALGLEDEQGAISKGSLKPKMN